MLAFVLIVVGAALGEAIGILGQVLGPGRQYQGPMGKSDRALWFGLATFLMGCGVAVGDERWVHLWQVMTAMTAWTLLRRARASMPGEGSA